MKRFLLSLLAIFFPFLIFAQTTFSDRVNSFFQNYTGWFNDFIFYNIPITKDFQIPWVVIVLIGGAIFFTIYFKFINFTEFFTAIRVVKGDYEDIEALGAEELYKDVDPEEHEDVVEELLEDDEHLGEVSHFQALATALSATVGLGNIAGVGVAISIGGPGATFWMIVSGLLGMATKFAECTLGVKYRDIDQYGTVYGGPMYYLSKGLAQKGMVRFGRVLAIAFAILVTGGAFGIGNMFQANQATAQFVDLLDLNSGAGVWIGIILALLVGLVVVGGVKRIASVTEKVVPFMAVLYVGSALVILAVNYHHIGDAFSLIFSGAFSGLGIAGGLVGVLIQGIQRGTFSNEAGLGSAPTAHAAVRTRYPASEGIVALLEPFIDTVVICTMTALVIIIANFDHNVVEYGHAITEGVTVTAAAFDASIPHFSIVLTIAVILFALSTMISWSYYGVQGWMYLFGKSTRTRTTYNILFCIGIWVGSVISLDAVIDFADAMNFAMAVPNIIGVLILASVVRKELKRYKDAIKIKHKALDRGLEDVNEKI